MMQTLRITTYERSHRQRLLDLIFHSRRVYTHLDWQDAGQWLALPENIVYLAWEGNKIIGILGLAPPLEGTTWMRLAILADGIPARTTLGALWARAEAQLKAMGVQTVAVLVIDDWLLAYLPDLSFTYQEDIITLSRDNFGPLPERPTPNIHIRAAIQADLPHIVAVDQTAFQAPWQMSAGDIRQAERIAATCTVALTEQERIVGYQLSTLYGQSGHLARLAVLPEMQGTGIASHLLENLIRGLQRRNARTLTVNTQASNTRSQRLYIRYGFQRNGYDLPVWMTRFIP